MNALQYIVVVVTSFAVIGTPYMLVLAVRRKQKMRMVDIIACDLMLIYVALDIAFPSVAVSMPRSMHWSYLIVLLEWITNAVGLFRRRLISRQEVPSERR